MATGGKKPGEPLIQSETAKRSEFIRQLQHLIRKEQNFEKEKQTHLYSKHGSLSTELADVRTQEENARTLLNTEKQKLKQQLKKIKSMVQKFQRELIDVNPTPEFVDRLRETMEEIQEQISSFKLGQKQHYDELMRDETISSQEVAMFDNKFDSWATLGPPRIEAKRGKLPEKLSSHRDITQDLPPQVAAFERFISRKGGLTGEWDEKDHQDFLRIRNRHKGKASFFVDLIASLPYKTAEEVEKHEMWYQEYLDLHEQKKEAIQRWKEKREVQKETMLAKAEREDSEDEDQEARKKQQLQEIIEQERQERRAQLNKWKVDKELERAEEQERKLRQELEKARKEEEERRLHEEQKAKVEEYRRQKEEDKEQREYMKQLNEQLEKDRRMQATQEVQKLQQRDLAQVKKKVAKSKAEEEEKKVREQRIQTKLKSHNESHIQRDPSRLLQPTAGWKNRQRDTSSSGGQLMHMPHRAVPTWRQT